MAARKKTTTRKNTQYVRAKKRNGPGAGLVAQRSIVVGLGVAMLLALLVGIVLGFRWIGRKLYSENPRFEIQHLVVSCNGSRLTEEYIREISGLGEGMNLFEFSFKEIEQRLEEVSMIESVYLERQLPDTMVVQVKERVPVAQILGRQPSSYPPLVDRYGYVMPHRRKLATLPLIKGLDLDLAMGQQVVHSDIEHALKIIALCESDDFLHIYVPIESIDLQYPDYIHLYTRTGCRAKLPRYSFDARLNKLAAAIKQSNDSGKRPKTADVTLDTISVPVTFY